MMQEREPKCFYHQLNDFVLTLILYISEEVSDWTTSLYQLKIVKKKSYKRIQSKIK